MSEPFIGEIRQFSGVQAPPGWALCDGRLLSVDDHRQLFELLGNQFGGDGRRTFALPALTGREHTDVPPTTSPGDGLATRFIIAVEGRTPPSG